MNNLPTKYGSLTLVRRLGSRSYTETYEGYQAEGEQGRVLVRRVIPAALADTAQRQAIETRVRDLMGVRHPFLVPVVDLLTPSGECFMVEQWVEAISLSTMIRWCRENGTALPHNVFLNLSTQICNGLEALHGRPGKASGSPNVLHMGLRPSSLFVNLDGRVMLGGYALARSPALPTSDDEPNIEPSWISHLAPEQTDAGQKLIPASDIFGLATILYELLSLQPLFQADTALQTLQKLRRAEITTQLLRVKDVMPGLDKVLYRALSSSPRHRYQRAFVLREDLRGLMAGYSFANIADDTRRFLDPILASYPLPSPTPATPSPLLEEAQGPVDSFDDKVSTRIDPDPRTTAAYASQALAERAAREQQEQQPAAPTPAPMPASFPPPRGAPPQQPAEPTSTAAYIAQAEGRPLADSGPTLAPPEYAPESGPAAPPFEPPPASAPFASPPAAAAVAPPPSQPLQEKPAPPARESTLSTRSSRLAAIAPPPGRRPPEATPAERPAAPPVAAPPAAARPVAAPPAAVQPPMVDTAGPPIHPTGAPITDTEDDTGDWEPPRKRGKAMFMLVLVGLGLVMICSGSLWVGWRYFAASWSVPDVDLADYDIPDVEVEILDAPGLDGVAAVAPEDDPDPDADPEEDDPEPEPDPEPESTTARDRDAYDGSGSGSSNTSSGSSGSTSSNTSSRTSSGSGTSSSSGSSSSYTPRTSSSSSGGSSSGSGSSYTSRSSGSSGSSSSSGRSSSSGSTSSYSSRSSASSSSYQADPVSYDDGLTDLSIEDGSEAEPDDSNTLLDRYNATASTGSLSSSDIMVVEMVQPEDAAFTRSRLLLVMNAKAKGDSSAVKRYLDELSLRPENQYNPVVLSEYARYYVNKRDYQRALDKAVLAERHWARLPPELVFVKKAEIYEVEAAAYQGLFYKSEDNLDLLDKSIRHWQKFREHVMTESRTDLQGRANREIEKLENIRDRLQ